ncbi:hypothetical protein CONLIGDRAFT_679713 [Coniochaeta ligniaria NRRL 30616]|uniref:Uncharacterized protein n=1 Tax=Coniochaeta ligniaria NRRL 30616 TaxID=1408157 RepID=A0A1J7JNQ6_9PEZI|nr:hypothetical protein CONLIGDRAFT_679713 [Coniochaeta ligniaria NRRL 30616]
MYAEQKARDDEKKREEKNKANKDQDGAELDRNVLSHLADERLPRQDRDRAFRMLLSQVMIRQSYATPLRLPDGSMSFRMTGMPPFTMHTQIVYATSDDSAASTRKVDQLLKGLNKNSKVGKPSHLDVLGTGLWSRQERRPEHGPLPTPIQALRPVCRIRRRRNCRHF